MAYYLVAAGVLAVVALFFQATIEMADAAAHMPRILCALIVFMTGLLLIDVHVCRRKSVANPETLASPEAPFLGRFFQGVNVPRVLVFIVAIILYVFLLEPVGYFIMTPVFLMFTLVFFKACPLWLSATISGLGTVLIYLVFVAFLNLPVPWGIMA